ncbi:MAG: chromosomal replication initiator protein DnaA [Candidatus Hydrogenedentes bacterium]|nr:chromosomal replication initiator protein DnaA [Candidatus Hydrogenedentota bacterium]
MFHGVRRGAPERRKGVRRLPAQDGVSRVVVGDQNPWDATQERLKKILDELSFENWFSPTHFDSYEDGQLTVSVPNKFFADWLREHYMDAVTACAGTVVPDLREVIFRPLSPVGGANKQVKHKPEQLQLRGMPQERPPQQTRQQPFNARYTFDRFVVGNGNRFAHAAARAVAETPGRAYNPLFLHGGTGLGKTHLMQAIGQEILQRRPDANICYISSEHFTNQLIESIAKKSTVRFRTKYRKADVLLIDDIHFISRKEATQEEFFHTFNVLFDSHKQIVISSDRPPKEIPGLEQRLISRFEWGLVTDIQPPDIETRIAILQNKAARENLTVPPDVLHCIAKYITSNIRELEGSLVTLLAYAKLTEKTITPELAEEVLRDLIGKERLQPINIEAILRAVAEHFDVRISDLRSRNRQRQVAYPRQLAMYLCKDLIAKLSYSEIGEALGGKDHTTVLYAVQKVTKETREDKSTAQLVNLLQRKIRG